MIKIDAILNHLRQLGYIYEYSGDNELEINGFSFPVSPKPSSIIWIKDLKKTDIELLSDDMGLLIVTGEKYTGDKNFNIISGKNTKGIFFSILDHFFNDREDPRIQDSSVVKTQNIGEGVSIGHNCTIDEGVVLGKGTTIKHNVVILGRVIIGEDCFIDSGTVIGAHGSGFYMSPEGVPIKVPEFGGVVIGDRVGIGCINTICRGIIGDTRIENDVKIANLCQIAHDVHIGTGCSITSANNLAGGVRIEKKAYVAPSSAIDSQVQVGEFAHVGIGSVVLNDVDAGRVVFGVPAKDTGDRKNVSFR